MITSSRPKRALLTGVSGFIGSNLVEYLSKKGWQTGAISRPASAGLLEMNQYVDKRYIYTGETSEIVDAVTDFRPDIVFHLGSLFLAQHTTEQIEPLVMSNILFGTQLLEAMRIAKVTALINAGTAWQNFSGNVYNPVNLYAATKQAFEDILLYYVEVAGFRAITLRLFDSYGPGDTRRKLLWLLLDCLKTGKPLQMSPGDQIIDLTYIDDICDAFACAADHVTTQDDPGLLIYGLSGGDRRTLREVVSVLEQAAGKRLPVEFGSRPYRDREVMNPWHGPKLMGWEPRISLPEGMRRVLRYPEK